MPLIKWSPFATIDKTLEDFFVQPTWLSPDLAVDIYQDDAHVTVEMHVPGVTFNDIDIEIEDNTLYISGTRKEEHETKEKDYYAREIKRGTFERIIPLPVPVIAEKAEAKKSNGTLTIVVPKQPETKPNKIKVTKKL